VSAVVLPARIATLPVDPQRGLPVPWFVAWIDGKPDFRVVDKGKFDEAIKFKRCWVCGQQLGRNVTFPLGPMCGITRTTAEPPCHRECAVYSAEACPFLTKTQMHRRDKGLPEGAVEPPGVFLRRNPGVTLLWTCREFTFFRDRRQGITMSRGGTLIRVGEPTEVLWYCQGRAATRAEVDASVESGLPLLGAEEEGPAAVAELGRLLEVARKLMPAVAP
jgi:hypothetical protein